MDEMSSVDEAAPDDVTTGVGARSTKKLVVGGLALVLVVGAVVVGVSSTGTSANAAAIVRAALVSSVGDKTVAFTLDEQMSGAVRIEVTGNGACDFSSANCNVTFAFGGQYASLGQTTAVYTNGMVYMMFQGAAAAQLPTPWMSLSLNMKSLSQTSPLGSSQDPLSAIARLAQLGDQVTDDGVVTVNGTSMHEYTVTQSASVSQGQMNTAMGKLPSWMSKASSSTSVNGETLNVYINSAGQLGEIADNTSITDAGKTVQVSTKEIMTGYGAPVSVIVPPANEVTPLSSLLNGLT